MLGKKAGWPETLGVWGCSPVFLLTPAGPGLGAGDRQPAPPAGADCKNKLEQPALSGQRTGRREAHQQGC